MKKIIEFIRNLNVVDKFLIICVLVVTILLVVNAIITLKYTSVFAVKEESGNSRWLQVEAIIEDTNKKAENAADKVKELESLMRELHKDIENTTSNEITK